MSTDAYTPKFTPMMKLWINNLLCSLSTQLSSAVSSSCDMCINANEPWAGHLAIVVWAAFAQASKSWDKTWVRILKGELHLSGSCTSYQECICHSKSKYKGCLMIAFDVVTFSRKPCGDLPSVPADLSPECHYSNIYPHLYLHWWSCHYFRLEERRCISD